MRTTIKSHLSQAGFSLVELIVASGISTIVALGSGAVMIRAVKSEQHGQAVADAARAGEILKRSVFSRKQGLEDCSNNMQLEGGFNAVSFTGDGIPLRIQNVASFDGDIIEGANTPYGEIIGFRIIGSDAIPEYIDIDGNSVYQGVVFLQVRRGERDPVVPIYLGALGLRVASDGVTFQGCAITTDGDDDVGVEVCDGVGDDFLLGGPLAGGELCGVLPAAPNPDGGGSPVMETGEPAFCPPGQAIAWRDQDPNDTIEAKGFCQEIISIANCGCIETDDDDCSDFTDTHLALTGVGNGAAEDCKPLPDAGKRKENRTLPTPTPGPPVPTAPPGVTPEPPPPTVAYPTPTPSATPTPDPPPPPPNTQCGVPRAALACQEICIAEGWLGRFTLGGDCLNACPSVTPCPTPIEGPVSAIAPTPTPYVAPVDPPPVNGQCMCGGALISPGEFCGSCVQEYGPEIDVFGRGYIFRDRRQSLRCIGGNLVPSGVNPNIGSCPAGPGGGVIPYEYW